MVSSVTRVPLVVTGRARALGRRRCRPDEAALLRWAATHAAFWTMAGYAHTTMEDAYVVWSHRRRSFSWPDVWSGRMTRRRLASVPFRNPFSSYPVQLEGGY